jgi:N utilization substance protein B
VRIASRRKARELALKVLYQSEVGKVAAVAALNDALQEHDVHPDLADYARTLVVGVKEQERRIDERLARRIPDYDYSRLATVDRILLRIATFELFHLPAVPPAVSIDEAIEMARKYSTSDSPRFVNGVLGRILAESPKANWNPETAPPEFPPVEEEDAPEAEEPEVPAVEEVELAEDSDEARRVARIGGWTLRRTDPSKNR